jgi:hypothetical protein
MLGQPGTIVKGIEVIGSPVRAHAYWLRYLRVSLEIASACGDNRARRSAETYTYAILQVMARGDGFPVVYDQDIIVVTGSQEQGGAA